MIEKTFMAMDDKKTLRHGGRPGWVYRGTGSTCACLRADTHRQVVGAAGRRERRDRPVRVRTFQGGTSIPTGSGGGRETKALKVYGRVQA